MHSADNDFGGPRKGPWEYQVLTQRFTRRLPPLSKIRSHNEYALTPRSVVQWLLTLFDVTAATKPLTDWAHGELPFFSGLAAIQACHPHITSRARCISLDHCIVGDFAMSQRFLSSGLNP